MIPLAALIHHIKHLHKSWKLEFVDRLWESISHEPTVCKPWTGLVCVEVHANPYSRSSIFSVIVTCEDSNRPARDWEKNRTVVGWCPLMGHRTIFFHLSPLSGKLTAICTGMIIWQTRSYIKPWKLKPRIICHAQREEGSHRQPWSAFVCVNQYYKLNPANDGQLME